MKNKADAQKADVLISKFCPEHQCNHSLHHFRSFLLTLLKELQRLSWLFEVFGSSLLKHFSSFRCHELSNLHSLTKINFKHRWKHTHTLWILQNVDIRT